MYARRPSVRRNDVVSIKEVFAWTKGTLATAVGVNRAQTFEWFGVGRRVFIRATRMVPVARSINAALSVRKSSWKTFVGARVQEGEQ